MAENKKGFILYADLISTIEKLPDEIAGKLFKIILEYVNDKHPIIDDLLLQIAFEPIKMQLKRDLEKWDEFKKKQSINGSLGGRPKKDIPLDKNPKNPSLVLESQKSLNVNDNVNVNVNEIDNKYLFYLDLFEKIEIDIWEKLDYDKKMKRFELMEKEFINSESWLINISRNINVSFDVLKIELSNFLTEIQLKTEIANTFPNNKNYFINWLKSKNKEKVKINNYQNKNNQKSLLQELTEINRLADLQIDEMYGK
jgi:hypothetical protein